MKTFKVWVLNHNSPQYHLPSVVQYEANEIDEDNSMVSVMIFGKAKLIRQNSNITIFKTKEEAKTAYFISLHQLHKKCNELTQKILENIINPQCTVCNSSPLELIILNSKMSF